MDNDRSLKRKSIHRHELSKLAMIAGNENRITKIAMEGEILQWIGIGWVTNSKYENIDTVSIEIPIVKD